jgi:hypothetical protein
MQQYMEAVELDRGRVPGYPQDPATVKHRLDTAKAILSDPRMDADSRREAAAIVAKSDKPGVNETVENVRAGMAEIYRRRAPKIERHKDSFLAGQLYDELENYAELHGAEREFKQMMNSARNRAHMEYDTNPGGFHNWFWFLPFEDENVEEAISKKDLLAKLQKNLPKINDPKNKHVKPVNWTGPGKDDYGYTGYQGHGMPTDKQERDRIRADKKKGVAEGTDDVKKRMSKLEALALAANRAGDDAKCKMYQQKIQSLKQKLSQSMAEGKIKDIDIMRQDLDSMSDLQFFRAHGMKKDQFKYKYRTLLKPAPQQDVPVQESLRPGEYHIHTVYFKDGSKKRIRVTSDEFDVVGYYTKRGQAVDRVDYDYQIHSDMTEAEKEPTTRQELLNRVDKIQRMMTQERNPANLQILRKELDMLKQRYQHLREDSDGGEAVEMAIMRRMLIAHTDLIVEFGLDKVVAAIEEVAYNVGDTDEIGSSDVSGWVNQVKQTLGVDA